MDNPSLRRTFSMGGIAAGAPPIIPGVIGIWRGASARSEVHDTISTASRASAPRT